MMFKTLAMTAAIAIGFTMTANNADAFGRRHHSHHSHQHHYHSYTLPGAYVAPARVYSYRAVRYPAYRPAYYPSYRPSHHPSYRPVVRPTVSIGIGTPYRGYYGSGYRGYGYGYGFGYGW